MTRIELWNKLRQQYPALYEKLNSADPSDPAMWDLEDLLFNETEDLLDELEQWRCA